MFKKFFRMASGATSPVEPILPKENFSIFKMHIEEGLALATINTGYNQYPNKSFYPWYTEVIMKIQDKNDNGHPTDEETRLLNHLEEKITTFLQEKQTIHSIGRVTRNGARDLIYYMDEPKLEGTESKVFFDSINAIRQINMTQKKDEKWSNVKAYIK